MVGVGSLGLDGREGRRVMPRLTTMKAKTPSLGLRRGSLITAADESADGCGRFSTTPCKELFPMNYDSESRPSRPADHSPHDSIPPTNFNDAACPIIARHYYGLRSVGEIAAEVVADPRSRQKATRVHPPRPL